jgi:hypothetical protein
MMLRMISVAETVPTCVGEPASWPYITKAARDFLLAAFVIYGVCSSERRDSLRLDDADMQIDGISVERPGVWNILERCRAALVCHSPEHVGATLQTDMEM